MKADYTFRVYVGPYHLHYNWSVLNYGAAFSPNNPTVATSQASGSTSLIISSATGFASTGGCWVGPNGSGEGWEYEQWTSRSGTTLTVVREPTADRDHNGAHTSGARVTQWNELTTNTGQITLTEETDNRLAAVTWRASISGVRAPHQLLRNGHVVVVTQSVNGGSATVFLVGFVDSPTISDNADGRAEWTLNIVSAAGLVAEVEAEGVKIGDTDLASAGSATGITELVLPADERPSDDFGEASPDLSASSVVDGEISTLWIAEHFCGTDIWSGASNGDPENDDTLAFAHIYINPPPSAGPGARYIELRVRGDAYVKGMALNSADGTGGENTTIWIFNGPGDVQSGGSIFLVEDQEVFQRLNPLAESAAIYENRDFWTHIRAAGGELWLRLGELNQWKSRVRWGDGNGYINHVDSPETPWDGPAIAAPAVGETLRYIWTASGPNPADYWDVSRVHHAGYNIDNDDPMWVMVTLPGMGLTLSSNISSSAPGVGGFLYLYGKDEKYSTDGLSTSGTLLIGDEQISYSSKTSDYVVVSGRGAGGTVADDHVKGDEIYIMAGSTPTDAFRVTSIGWSRSRGTIYPKSFKLYTTPQMENVRNPDQENYLTDWTLRTTVTNNVASSYAQALTNVRVKHILVEIFSMTTDPARPRLNAVHAIMDTALQDPNLYLATDTTSGAFIQQLLINAGIPSGAIAHSGTSSVSSTVTATDNAWAVCVDIAEFCGCRITVGRDSKFIIAPDTFWTTTPTVSVTWDQSSATQFDPSFRRGNPISQVILPWRTPSAEDSGKVFYPTTPGRGTKMELKETLYSSGSAAAAAAQRLYFMNLYPFEATLAIAETAITYRAGELHAVSWLFDPTLPAFSRNYAVLSTEHKLEKGHWSTTLRLMQWGHESNF